MDFSRVLTFILNIWLTLYHVPCIATMRACQGAQTTGIVKSYKTVFTLGAVFLVYARAMCLVCKGIKLCLRR